MDIFRRSLDHIGSRNSESLLIKGRGRRRHTTYVFSKNYEGKRGQTSIKRPTFAAWKRLNLQSTESLSNCWVF